MTLNWLIDRRHSDILICTDSQALLSEIDSYADSVSEAIDLLNTTPGLVLTVQWVPGHCGRPQCCCRDLFRSRDRDRDLDKMNLSALESRDHDPEITTPVASIPIGDRALALRCYKLR